MYFSDMRFAQEEHTDTGLADSSADGVGKLFVQNRFLEIQLAAVIAACQSELAVQRLSLIHI